MLQALRARGQTVELVRVPDATHVIWSSGAPLHRYLQWALLLGWFETHVKGRTAAGETEGAPAAAAVMAHGE
jgi:dipeptidyl aminopeptidase/acylaminoacyl peptidase